ncbi:hypothetical protein DY000_02049643 [Brassica cretica]|uniref:Kinesin motor domain-containing protein n=1 Tax=Brassica cretica TaxID=69181 RepID=A0ABQ7F6Y5_BRACR|nr:hypothetical protein DY000_02049643 [Brassica cretica]
MAFESELGYWRLQSHSEEDTTTATFRTIPGVSLSANAAEFDRTTSFLRFLCNRFRKAPVCSYTLRNFQKSSGRVLEKRLDHISRIHGSKRQYSQRDGLDACLDQGLVSRASGSTNMDNQSSRSHAISTITVEQMRKINTDSPENGIYDGSLKEEYLCAKLHIVYLAGSERAKRTGSDGMKVKEGVYINKGLLALGNVISALEDERKRKHGAHVPYRDTCISAADINAEETLNTLKYAIRARNIRNKPVVNRDHVSSEMLKMRQQLEYLQAELPLRDGGSSCANSRYAGVKHSGKKIKDIQYDEIIGLVKPDGLKRSLHSMESSNYAMVEATIGKRNLPKSDSREIDEEAKEWEHKLLQSSMDKELHELNRRLEEKESEMKLFDGYDPAALKQHFGKKVAEVEDEKRFVQVEYVLHLMLNTEVARCACSATDGEAQLQDLKKNQENHCQLLKQKQKSDDAARRLEEEFYPSRHIRMKQEAEQFRQWKASREKELVQTERASIKGISFKLRISARKCLAEEFSVLRQVDELAVKGLSPPRGKNGFVRASSLSPNARMARISSFENSSAYLQIL